MGFDILVSIILNLIIFCILMFLFFWANISLNGQQKKKDKIYNKIISCKKYIR
tara:strand:- start:2886 stop:3044 length:159 start_codon:yes stop_codon:yes gene_type:complete